MSAPTRLLLTLDAVGGVWQYALDLARALQPLGIEPVLALLGPAPTEVQRTAAAGLRLIETGLPLDWLAPDEQTVRASARAIADVARHERVDLIQLNQPALAAEPMPAPVVAVAHGCVGTWWHAAYGCAPDPAYAWHGALMRAGLLAADRVVAPSAAFAADLRQVYALPATPLVVHNGRAPSTVAGQGAPAQHALTAGRLWDRVKQTAVLDEAAALLSAPIRAAGPVTGPHGETVAPRHLRLLGNLSADALAAELAAQPVFVSTASFEPFGLAVLEAAQAGCALVLSDIPTFRELWNDVAVFVPLGNAAATAAAIDALLDDSARRADLGGHAQRRAARYTPAATARRMDGIFAELLSHDQAAA